MKHTKRKSTALLLAALLLGFSACSQKPAGQSSASERTESVEETSSSGSSRKADDNHSWGYDIEFPGIMPKSDKTTNLYNTYDYAGGELKANAIAFNNGRGSSEEMGLMVLSDGIPLEYTVEKTGEKGSYQTFTAKKKTIEQIRFTPNFASKIGRLDFIFFFDLQGGSSIWHASQTYAVMNLPEGYEPPEQKEYREIPTSPTPEQMKGLTGGTGSHLSVYHTDDENTNFGIFTGLYDFSSSKEIGLCWAMGTPGRYRFFLLLDYQPLALIEDETLVEVEIPNADECLMLKIPCDQIPSGTHSLIAVAVKVDAGSLNLRTIIPPKITIKT